MRWIAGLIQGIVIDPTIHSNPAHNDAIRPARARHGLRDATGDAYAEQVMPVAAQRGEPWLTFLAPGEMSELLTGHGFGPVRQVAQRDIGDATTWVRTDSLRPVELSMIAHATVVRAD